MIAAVLALALVGLWQLYATFGGVDPIVLPAPSKVVQAVWDDRGLLGSNLAVTAEEVALGLLVAITAAILFALAIHLSATLRRALLPLLVASQAIPIVIIAPLLIAWLGYNLLPRLVIVAIVAFFPIVVTTLGGLSATDPSQRKLLRTLGASRWQALRHVEAPSALPALLSGTKIAVAVAVIGAVLAEQAGSTDGLGHLAFQSSNQLETPQAFAAVAVLAALAVALFATLALAERRLAPWAHQKGPDT